MLLIVPAAVFRATV